MLIAPVGLVPRENDGALFRKLLELSFLMISDAAFAIDAQTSEMVVRSLRRLSRLDYEEFEDLLETVGIVANKWGDIERGVRQAYLSSTFSSR